MYLMRRLSLLIVLFWCGSTLLAQDRDSLRETLFSETNKLLAQVQAEQGNILSPSNFENAMNRYNQAVRYFDKKKELRNIENKLAEVNKYLQQCLETAKLGKVTFASTLKAREDALKANAPQYAEAYFNDAENAFMSAAKSLESGKVKKAKRKVPEIDKLYRQAELIAIKASIIGNVRNLIEEAKDLEAHKYTPITFANAQKYLSEAESILNSNRRSEASAREKAEKAETEAKHAIYLTRQIKWLKKNEKEWENQFLKEETLVEQIAKMLGFEATFEEGLEKPLKNIAQIVDALQGEKRDLLKEVEEKNAKLKKLEAELQEFREKEQGLQAELREKQYKLELKRQREELIKSVEAMFSPDEATVLRKGDDLIIRLIGLTFPSGRATIRPEFFALLAKVQRAIRKFPNAPITIEGHTDSIGDDRFNENLSYERAMAVKQYILANMGLDESRITALGYGESRPIASNETAQGRAQNRRIDIVITFTPEVM